MYSYKNELLRLLDDPEVRRKIFKILDEREENFSSAPVTQNLYRSNDDASRQAFADAERNLKTLRNEIVRLKDSLSQAQQQATKFRRDAETWQQSYDNANDRAETYRRQLEDAQREISQLESSVDELQTRLQESFARGQELFEKYQRVGAHARQILGSGVFVRNDFTSFICGGAQTDSLERIWDVLKSCVMSGNRNDAEILWEVFEYCLELVNTSKSGRGFSILPVKVGDRFDSDIPAKAVPAAPKGAFPSCACPVSETTTTSTSSAKASCRSLNRKEPVLWEICRKITRRAVNPCALLIRSQAPPPKSQRKEPNA